MKFRCIKCNFEPLVRRETYYYCKNCLNKYSIKFEIPIFLNLDKPYLIKEIKGMQIETGLANIPIKEFLIRRVEHVKSWEELINENNKKGFNYYEMVKINFDRILSILKLKGDEKTLEIGCGSSSYILKKLQMIGCEVWGVDICFRLDKNNKIYKNLNLVVSDMNNLPFSSSSFDIVFASSCIHHTPYPLITFKEINRVLKKNGKFIMLNEPTWGILKSLSKPPSETPRHYLINEHRFSAIKYLYFLKKAGLKVKFLFPPYIEKKLNEGDLDNFRFGKIGKLISVFFKDKFLKKFLIKFSPLPASVIFGMGISVLATKKEN